jgi:hypothetical protein
VKRSKAIRLVLLGGGTAVMLAACGDDRARREACERARAEMRPDAEQICRRSTSSRTGLGAWAYGRTAPRGDASAATSSATSRGGFGSSARSFSSGS